MAPLQYSYRIPVRVASERFILLECFVFTARKRSLGQGNMFTGVCLSTGGVPGSEGVWSGGVAWSRGGGSGPHGRPPQTATAADGRILLECILVIVFFFHFC